jgi:DNA (cytosine-5)-methyltransferase 3A
MKVLSLFDGMSCGRIALDRAGVKVDAYYASEVDKYAQIVSEKNYPDIIRLGDVNGWQEWDLSDIDMIIAGSPCQGFSNAGKGLNFDDPRSKLFWVFVDILKEYRKRNPNIYFMLENVMMKKEWQQVITDALGVDPIMINSALLSAQNRKRLYWTNIPDVGYPCGKDIILADIIETADYIKTDKKFNSKMYQDKASTLSGGAHSGGNMQPKVALVVPEATKKRYTEIMPNEGVDLSFPNSKTRRGRRMSSKSNALTAAKSDFNWYDGITYRRLSVVECERLQTLPDNYTVGVSNTQRYKMLGNGWTVDVIAHIFSFMSTCQ